MKKCQIDPCAMCIMFSINIKNLRTRQSPCQMTKFKSISNAMKIIWLRKICSVISHILVGQTQKRTNFCANYLVDWNAKRKKHSTAPSRVPICNSWLKSIVCCKKCTPNQAEYFAFWKVNSDITMQALNIKYSTLFLSLCAEFKCKLGIGFHKRTFYFCCMAEKSGELAAHCRI